jgi:hypothetical protein
MAIYYQNQFRNYYLGSTGSLGAMYYGNVEVNPGSTIAPALWTPADLSNLYVWWRADEGITTSGTNVTSWTSKAGVISRTLTQEGGTTNSVYNSSNSSFNNKATVLFPSNLNGVLGYYDTSSGLGGQTTTLSVCFIMSPLGLPAGGYRMLGGFASTGGSFMEFMPAVSVPSSADQYSGYFFTGGQQTSGVSATNGPPAQFMIADLSNQDLKIYPNSTTPVNIGFLSVAATGFTTCQWALGGYIGGGGLGFYGEIMEMIVTTGTRWTAQDVSDLSNYVNTYY